MAIPLSISRALFFQLGVTLIFTVLGIARKPKYIGKLVMASMLFFIVLTVLNQVDIFQTATAAFFNRFDTASGQEGGLEGTLVDRYLGGMKHALEKSSEMPFFGYGIGMGTNVGSMLLAGGRAFLLAEEEWERNIGELGALLGLGVIAFRLGICIRMTLKSYYKLLKGDILPWLLLSFGLLTIPQGQWAQPTALGFGVLVGGLIMASVHNQKENN
jgi:hypothetical protein